MVNSASRQLDRLGQTGRIDPDDYQIRESKRAKHVSIKVSHLGEVEVVVPPQFDRRELAKILAQRQRWIEKHLHRIAAERRSLSPKPEDPLPAQILLRSLSEEWTIDYQLTQRVAPSISVPQPGRLVLRTLDISPDICYPLLRHWLSQQARIHFDPWLQDISQTIQLSYSAMSVRGQKTRWASCSSRKSISLNYKLLFLPPALVRYVFIHELCHTVHLNHSTKFWALVGEKEPHYKSLDRDLRTAWRYVPEWVDR
ncbi:MAG: M48 family metallopeptidase [Elainellaceae cyanobacterium]